MEIVALQEVMDLARPMLLMGKEGDVWMFLPETCCISLHHPRAEVTGFIRDTRHVFLRCGPFVTYQGTLVLSNSEVDE